MISSKLLEDLTKKILSALPKDLQMLKHDFETNVRACVKTSLEKFDLVSREEFDIQARALHRAKDKLEALAKRIEELEKNHS